MKSFQDAYCKVIIGGEKKRKSALTRIRRNIDTGWGIAG